VYALPEVLSRPAPRGCADNVHAAVLDAAANRVVVALVLDAPLAFVRAVVLVHRAQRDPLCLRLLHGAFEQVVDDLVTDRGDADSEPASAQRADHLRARVGLTRAGRTLDRKHVTVQLEHEPLGGLDRRLALALELATIIRERGRPAKQQVERRAIRRAVLQPVLEHVLAKAHQRVSQNIVPDVAVKRNGGRMLVRRRDLLLDIDGPLGVVDIDDLTQLFLADVDIVAAACIELLPRKTITLYRRPLCLDDLLKYQPRDRPPLIRVFAFLEAE